jgi:hypothetical protein
MVRKLCLRTIVVAKLAMISFFGTLEVLGAGVDADSATRQWLELYAKNHETPVYAESDISSRVLYRLGMGRSIEVKIDPRDISTAERSGWLQIARDESLSVTEEAMGLESAGGWLRLSDFFQVSDFRRVKEWPFRYLIIESYPFVIANCFSKDGKVEEFVRGEGDSDRFERELFIAGNVVAIGNRNEPYKGAGVLAVWDRKHQRLCPPGLSQQQCNDFYLNKGKYPFDWYVGFFAASKGQDDDKKFDLYCN